MAYERNVQSIIGLCSPMPEGENTVADYVRWLAMEVNSLPEVFFGVNENFASAAVEGALAMARDSVDLADLQASAAVSRADELPGGRDIRKTTRTTERKWWRSFDYASTLATVQARLCKVGCVFVVLTYVISWLYITLPFLFQTLLKGGRRLRLKMPVLATRAIEGAVDAEVTKIGSECVVNPERASVADATADDLTEKTEV
jgi:hypothetical protein